MRLNIRLIGLLNGILLLGLVGLRVLAFGGGGRGNNRDGGASPILLVALAMMILGFVGQFFAGLIKAAVSRQREWLADASSVQFTRQTTGLEGALKKIAGVPTGSTLQDKRSAQEVNHMLFGEGGRSFSQLFATHPPLFKRIAALDPAFQPAQLDGLQQEWTSSRRTDWPRTRSADLPQRRRPPYRRAPHGAGDTDGRGRPSGHAHAAGHRARRGAGRERAGARTAARRPTDNRGADPVA